MKREIELKIKLCSHPLLFYKYMLLQNTTTLYMLFLFNIFVQLCFRRSNLQLLYHYGNNNKILQIILINSIEY